MIASDEDGVDPSPLSVTVFLDVTPPSRPALLEAPKRVSRDGKPSFRFSSRDDHSLPGEADHPGVFYQPFYATLRRLRPPGRTIGSSNPFGSYVSVSRERCFTTFECSAYARPVYSAYASRGLWTGFPELLAPGLYEFRVQARDAVGNESATTTHRFRILRPRPRPPGD
ncbi:MAG TPA: hypothetical protein VF729_08780 [Solirubrobacterales bacterium]